MRPACFVLVWSVVAVAGVAACRARPMPHTAWSPRFGPVISNELVVGRASRGDDVWLATSLDVVVHVRLAAQTYERIPIRGREASEHLWGLAINDGRLWTLLGRHALAELAPDGTILQRLALSAAHVGLFGSDRQLLYQIMDFNPPADALSAGPPGEAGRRPWGGIRTRAMALDRGSAAALNLLSCGASAAGSVPCWFPDEAALSVVDAGGGSRRLELEGLPLVQREVLLASESPRKPIRDAFISAIGEIWILGSGPPPFDGHREGSGGLLLATYTPGGQLTRRLELPEPARLVLKADGGSCVLLASSGSVVEVRP